MLPALTGNKDQSLTAALSRMIAEYEAAHPEGPDAAVLRTPETDDPHVTAVRRLPDRQAHVVALHYLEDRLVAETAAILELAEGTVKAHLHKARLALARSLGLLAEAEEDER